MVNFYEKQLNACSFKEKVMKNLINEVNKLALAEINAYGFPTLSNYNLSLEAGVSIAKHLGANADLVKLGIMLMDIKLGEAIKLGKQPEHIKMSEVYAEQILNNFNVDSSTKELFLNCVIAHHGGVPYKSLEAEICVNADCYRFIHPQGVFTKIQNVSRQNKSHNESIDMVLAKLEEKHNILSLPICKEELEPLYVQIKNLLLMAKIK